MSYFDQATLSIDPDFLFRVAAAAAVEVDLALDEQPIVWANNHVWLVAAAPGFADAYSSAIVNGVPNPGRDPAVISDGQILSAIQALIAEP